MEITFLDTTLGCEKLILIFPGWSFGKNYYVDIHQEGWDTAVISGYNDLSIDITPLKKYSTIYLFAWSLGVYMASLINFEGLITSGIAINGTLTPADDNRGIPKRTFELTAKGLTPSSLRKFRKRMAGTSEIYNSFKDLDFDDETVQNLQLQLFTILNSQDTQKQYPIPWKKSFISENDKIFPFKNLKEFWTSHGLNEASDIIMLKEPHYVDMKRIVKLSIPSLSKIARNFSQAISTYNENAKAQNILAEALIKLIHNSGLKIGDKILEIGSGTGLLTKRIVEEFHPSHIDLVDISDFPLSFPSVSSTFYCEDAEKWIENSTETYDAILSSATVQWFVNLPRFLKHSEERLKEDGVIAFSTFLPGNLHELDKIRPNPLHYHTKEDIEKILTPYFTDIRSEEKEIRLEFVSPSELLYHLKATGVVGSAPEQKLPLSKIKKLKTLTFRCAIFSGKKLKNHGSNKN